MKQGFFKVFQEPDSGP